MASLFASPLLLRVCPLFLMATCQVLMSQTWTPLIILILLHLIIFVLNAHYVLELAVRPQEASCHKKQPGVQDPRIIAPGICEVPHSFLEAWKVRVEAACSMQHEGNNAKAPRRSNKGDMWTPGEQQFYAFALIDVVMAELPEHWRVGILYDIGCQIHRSALKWDLLPQWMPHIIFAISVFHVYSHQWVCQLWYHPQKGDVWGLTDGEGYDVKLSQAGIWLERRVKSMMERLFLAQQKRALQQQLVAAPVVDSIASRNEIGEITSAIAEQEKVISHLSKQDEDMTAMLQLGDPVSFKQLQKMKHHTWFEHQLNMRALKAQTITRVCEKNFETHNLTGAFRIKAVDHSTLQHTSRAIKRRYQSVKGLVADLADDEFNGDVPPWLGDEMVRNGIQLVQDIANCQDELELCWRERHSLKHWFDEELAAMMTLLNSSTGLLAEQIQAPAHARPQQSDRPRKLDSNGIESDVDSSDDDEDLELEPAPVLADMDILAASDLICQQCSDDGASNAGSSDWDSSIDL
ncbi:hypothetical protein BS47DRAFT_1445876 [Hydnum rufescens UP504]|uniref:Uncharacterized protein n=1 Tax=Hydnum rufescens UP504 TaxID=1448309 RepID=A0A9P6DH91_9AGAM|nr:hypothetical protein BS47DRAFT_1445876 [Hydnum rufescens UP504]